MTNHPAKFSDELMPLFQELIDSHLSPRPRVLDPFAGTGRIHELQRCSTIGIEIEPEWAAMSCKTIEGDARRLPRQWTEHFDMVITSPTYGNRMADHHEAKDSSKRITYRHVLGRPLSPGSSGSMQWGDEYRELHIVAWAEVWRVLKPDGLFVLNIRDHIRKGELVPVTDWHVKTIVNLGFTHVTSHYVPTPGMRFGANSTLRVDGETVAVFQKPRILNE